MQQEQWSDNSSSRETQRILEKFVANDETTVGNCSEVECVFGFQRSVENVYNLV